MKTATPKIEKKTSTQLQNIVSNCSLKNTRIAIIAFLFCAGNMAVAGETTNLVVNGGFETFGYGDNPAEGWKLKNAVCSGEQKHAGKTALKLPLQADDEKKQIEAQQDMDVGLFKVGDEVELSLYAMSTAKLGPGANPYARIVIQDSGWKHQAVLKIPLPSEPTSEWKKLSDKFTIPPEFTPDSHVRIQIVIWVEAKPETPGAIYVDDVQVTTRPAAKK